jgi:hypothetical protein
VERRTHCCDFAAMCRVMVFLLWALLLPIFFLAPTLFPLAMAIGFGLHWVVFPWTVAHPLGMVHASVRTFFALTAWFLFPKHRMAGVAFATAATYGLSIVQLRGAFGCRM